MGQQRLILILLGINIAGIFAMIVINIFTLNAVSNIRNEVVKLTANNNDSNKNAVLEKINELTANAVSSNRDCVVADLNNLGAMAQQYYRKPYSMGGGGNT